LRTAENNPDVLHREALRGEPPVNEAAVAAAIVGWAGGPIALEDLVDRAAEVLGLADVPVQTWTGDSDDEGERVPIADTLPDPGRSVLVALTDREELSRLWTEIQDLPVRQRQALLLNLRDGEGRGVVGLLPLTGTASLRQIADALEMGHGELAALWHDLPLDDAAIAGRLSATRQQVINLRKSARERLARRVRADRITTIAAGNTAGRSTSSLTHRA
jgi:hypothetical protein